jgi:hypothetical protein
MKLFPPVMANDSTRPRLGLIHSIARRMIFLAAAVSLVSMPARSAGLDDIKSVYLLPMAGGLDQYLAIRLTTGAILQVVTDPQKADAVFTDSIGAGLEDKLAELYNEKPKEKEKDDLTSDYVKPTMAPIIRGRGNIFLVDRKTRSVIWGTYEKPKGTGPDDVKHAADQIADKLQKNLKGK